LRDDQAAASDVAEGYRECHFRGHDGLQLYYRDYGDAGAGEWPVVCLAGLTRNSKDFHDLALRLAPRRRVIAPDYRGRGKSARDPNWCNYRPETYIADVLDLLAAAGLHKAVFVGTSMGGLLAMGLAAFRPGCLAGVILNDIGPEVEPGGYQRILSYISADRPQADWDAAIADVKVMFPNLSLKGPEQWRKLVEGTFRRGEDGMLHFDWDIALARGLGAARARFPDLWSMFRALGHVPVLAIRGALSDVLSATVFDRMAAELPGLMRAEIPGAGHVPALNEQEALDAINEFLGRV